MKAKEIVNELIANSWERNYTNTCDSCKSGSLDTDIDKVAVSMFATPEVIMNCKKWGAKLLIVHEPTYYNHMDIHSDERIENEKRKLIEESGVTIFRYHDYAHFKTPDNIIAGELEQMNLNAELEYTDIVDLVRINLKEPLTPVELAKLLEERLKIKHLRICGTRSDKCSKISLMPGTPNGVFDELKREETEILLTGEACEWSLGEYARDASQLGYKKALIIMGHIGSERDGMKYTANWIKNRFPDLTVTYFECGEVYTYTDSG